MNKVILMGRLVKDPEIRYTQSGKNVATFTLAVDRGLGKGRQVLIEGHMQVRNYDAQDGSKRYVTEVITEKLELIGNNGGNAGGSNKNSQQGGNSFGGTPVPSDEDIPF